MPSSLQFLLQKQDREIPCPNFWLSDGKIALGRAAPCQLVVPHDSVSRRHALLVVTRLAVTVTDLGSTCPASAGTGIFRRLG